MLVLNLGAEFFYHVTLRYNGQVSYRVSKIRIACRDFTELCIIEGCENVIELMEYSFV
jgi:hypothetical protein